METATVTLGSNCSSGSVLLAQTAMNLSGTSGTIVSVKDGAGNSFTKVFDIEDADHDVEMSLWMLATPSGDVGTTPTITATPSSLSTFPGGLLVQEISGIQAATDGTAGTLTADATGGNTASPTYSSTKANEYLVALFTSIASASTWTAPAGYSTDVNSTNPPADGIGQAFCYKNSTGGTEASSFGIPSGGQNWCLGLVAFQLTAAPAAGSGALAAVFP